VRLPALLPVGLILINSIPHMSEKLRNWHEAFENQKAEARALLTGYPRDVLNRQPDPKQWSACQIVAHLNVTAAMLVPELRKAEGAGGAHVSLGRLDGFFERDARDQGLEDDGVRVVPAFDHDPAALLERFERHQDELIELADADLALGRPHGQGGTSVASWLEGTWAHQARHLAEARATVAAGAAGVRAA
jgi:hypothetical protein